MRGLCLVPLALSASVAVSGPAHAQQSRAMSFECHNAQANTPANRQKADQWVQDRLKASFHANGQPLDWHFFQRAGHGFALADGDCYDPSLAQLAWTITADFLARELDNE